MFVTNYFWQNDVCNTIGEPPLTWPNTLQQEGQIGRGSAGGGNQLRQPYLKNLVEAGAWKQHPVTEHIHFYGMYIGNFPNLTIDEVDEITHIINSAVE